MRFAKVLTGVLLLWVPASSAQVTLVEPGHVLNQIVDSGVPLDPSQTQLDVDQRVGNIESIGIDPATRNLYVQVISSATSFSATTSIYRVVPATGVVTPVNVATGFAINDRGTDLHFDPVRGLLVTQDQAFGASGRIATVNPGTGAVGTYSLVTAPVFASGSTFGMDFSRGTSGSDVPPGDIVFTSDLGSTIMESVSFGGVGSSNHVPGGTVSAGDDMVIQPDGAWVHIGDSGAPITRFSPVPPHTATTAAVPDVATLFVGAGLPFVFGTRATVCDLTGDLYVSFSGTPGGSGIFRIDRTLTTATLVLTIGQPSGVEGLQDLTVGPSSSPGSTRSVYFTVHDSEIGTEEVWEVTAPECVATTNPAPVVSHWGLVSSTLLLATIGLLALRRRAARRL